MLKTKRSKLVGLSVVVLCAIGAGTAIAANTATDDHWNAGANQPFASQLASGSLAKFTSTLVTITCTNSTASGASIGAGPDVILPMNRPTFNDGTAPCTTNLGATATVTTAGTWHIVNISDASTSHCPAGTGGDETTGNGDCQLIVIPQDGVKVKFSAPLLCTLTIAPSGHVIVPLTVSDPGGTTPSTFTVDNAQVPFTGCGTSGTGTQTGTYVLTAPNGGVVFDNS